MIVIKIGGGEKINIENIAKDLVNLKKDNVIIVHGGNFYLDYYSKKLGIGKHYLESPTGLKSRHTTPKVIDLMYLTYAGLANKKIVASLQKYAINAIGLSGLDGKLITGKKHDSLLVIENGKKKIIKDDLTGSVKEINLELLKALLELNLVPVITPPVLSEGGEVINVDGDKITVKIAVGFKAKVVIFLIEAEGILKDLKAENSIIKEVTKENLQDIKLQVSGRMKRKIAECIKLLDEGVEKIIISDGRIKNPLTNALKGGGTHVISS